MPRTLSGLQTGEFDEVDILHSIQINSNPGGANQVLTSDGVNSNWNDIPSQLPAGTSKQILTVDTNNAPIFTDRSALVTGNLLVDGDGKLQLSSQPIVNDLRATDYIGGSDANNKASLNYISNLQCDTINGVAPSELPSGTVNQILTVGADGSAVFSDRNDLVSGNIEIDSNNNKITLKATPTVLSLLATENIGGPSPATKAGLVNISDINCQTINTQTPTISGVALGGFLPSLTISRSGGNRTYNGTGAINVPEPSRLIIAHKGTDLITYDSSLDTNQSVNIDTKTLTINVGNSTIHTYDTTVDKSVDIDFYTSGTNIGITDGVGNNRAVNLSIEETLVTSGNDINKRCYSKHPNQRNPRLSWRNPNTAN